MSNNPYLAPAPQVYIPRERGRLPVEMKRVWNRFAKLHRKMRSWHGEGKTEKVQRRMREWEERNRAAWAAGFEVPDQFDPDAPGLLMKLRGGAR